MGNYSTEYPCYSRHVSDAIICFILLSTDNTCRREENPKTGQQGGVIMNVSSMGGFIGFPGSAYYHTSKFAVEGFTESVQKEMRPEWNSKDLLLITSLS